MTLDANWAYAFAQPHGYRRSSSRRTWSYFRLHRIARFVGSVSEAIGSSPSATMVALQIPRMLSPFATGSQHYSMITVRFPLAGNAAAAMVNVTSH